MNYSVDRRQIEGIIDAHYDRIAREGFRLNEMPYLDEIFEALMAVANDSSLTYEDWIHELRYWDMTNAQDARGDEKELIDNLLWELKLATFNF